MKDELNDEDQEGKDLFQREGRRKCISMFVGSGFLFARFKLFFTAIAKAHFNIRCSQPNDYINSWIKIV